ncbi:hypothetical protein CesoFtcFv8_016411 [Champsocephalus esox]|uniref:Uncharacterized protein n=1 Tax=Champsocephalus esox TaxID=159716 RepID=A0AAN8BPS4_9TELE|nr:hypothetical protein CesoFtcFv8_016411 [Champsocephalus esox]
MAARFLTAREVLGKLYANAAAQDSRNLSSEEGEEEKEKEEHGEDEPGGQGVRGSEDAFQYGDELVQRVRVEEENKRIAVMKKRTMMKNMTKKTKTTTKRMDTKTKTAVQGRTKKKKKK